MDCGTAQVTATTKTKLVVYYEIMFDKARVVSVPGVVKTIAMFAFCYQHPIAGCPQSYQSFHIWGPL